MLGPKKVQFPTPRRPGQPRKKPVRQRVQVPPEPPKPKPKPKPQPPPQQAKVQAKGKRKRNPNPEPKPEPEPVEVSEVYVDPPMDNPSHVTLDEVAAQANEILEQMKRSGIVKPEPSVAACDLNSLAEIRESVERMPPVYIETRSSLFDASRVKTPAPGFSIRKMQGVSEQPPSVDYLTRTEAPLERLDTASEMIYPDGRRTQILAK